MGWMIAMRVRVTMACGLRFGGLDQRTLRFPGAVLWVP